MLAKTHASACGFVHIFLALAQISFRRCHFYSDTGATFLLWVLSTSVFHQTLANITVLQPTSSFQLANS